MLLLWVLMECILLPWVLLLWILMEWVLLPWMLLLWVLMEWVLLPWMLLLWVLMEWVLLPWLSTDPPREVELRAEPQGGVQEGRGFTLSCSGRAWPSSNYTWYLASAGAPGVSAGAPGVRVPLPDHGANLTVERAERRHGGLYYCLAGNYLGAKESDPVHLDILSPPRILPSSGCSRIAAWVRCSCDSVGRPSPSLEWRLDGKLVLGSKDVSVGQVNLDNTTSWSTQGLTWTDSLDLPQLQRCWEHQPEAACVPPGHTAKPDRLGAVHCQICCDVRGSSVRGRLYYKNSESG
ncbi:unnamed protein product [Arctogadus glacialis]